MKPVVLGKGPFTLEFEPQRELDLAAVSRNADFVSPNQALLSISTLVCFLLRAL